MMPEERRMPFREFITLLKVSFMSQLAAALSCRITLLHCHLQSVYGSWFHPPGFFTAAQDTAAGGPDAPVPYVSAQNNSLPEEFPSLVSCRFRLACCYQLTTHAHVS